MCIGFHDAIRAHQRPVGAALWNQTSIQTRSAYQPFFHGGIALFQVAGYGPEEVTREKVDTDVEDMFELQFHLGAVSGGERRYRHVAVDE